MPNFPSIPKDAIARVEDKVIEVYLQAQSIWNRAFALPSLDFNLLGRCAGRAYCRENRIRLNPLLLLENQADFIEETVPHEVAHLLARTLYKERRWIKPHGPEWKSVMLALGLKPIRCHTYDTANAQVRRERRFTYACDCRTVLEPTRTHRKLQRGEIWSRCSFCGARFAFQDLRRQDTGPVGFGFNAK